MREHSVTKKILAEYKDAEVVLIDHYKDVFCRKGQSHAMQHHAQNLILAAKTGVLVYQGAPVCQSFGNDHFYYTSCVMNCIYDCEYCYLKGMYPSANIVVFVNLEDIFAEIKKLLEKHPLYLCVSYDTDLMALERMIGYTDAWNQFAGTNENLTLEIRTKCANHSFFRNRKPLSNVIYAFTLSPQAVVDAYEHHTPSLKMRISCAAEAVRAGFLVRLCFDPMIYIPEWQTHYSEMLNEVFSEIAMDRIADCSVGSFRISKDYLKKMRKQEPYSAVVWFPFQQENGFYHYPKECMEQMEQFMVERLKEKIAEEKIFLWKE